MKYKFAYRPFVKEDLQKATAYYKAISHNLAKDFLYRIREAKKIYCSKSRRATPKEVTIEDKTAIEQVRLLAQLGEKDKGTVMNIIDTMLTKQKFQNFFEQNLQNAK